MSGNMSYATSASTGVHHPIRQAAFFGVLSDEAGRAQLGDSLDDVVRHVFEQHMLRNTARHREQVHHLSRGRWEHLDLVS
jgi:hypothetical protein